MNKKKGVAPSTLYTRASAECQESAEKDLKKEDVSKKKQQEIIKAKLNEDTRRDD